MSLKKLRQTLVRALDRRARDAWNTEAACLARCNYLNLVRETGDNYKAAVIYDQLQTEAAWHGWRARVLWTEADYLKDCDDDEFRELIRAEDGE
ncbi:hypothetical protein VZO05_10805 [Aggregatilineales bacterium SYSU G02658]